MKFYYTEAHIQNFDLKAYGKVTALNKERDPIFNLQTNNKVKK